VTKNNDSLLLLFDFLVSFVVGGLLYQCLLPKLFFGRFSLFIFIISFFGVLCFGVYDTSGAHFRLCSCLYLRGIIFWRML
jgi:hypothetical protein